MPKLLKNNNLETDFRLCITKCNFSANTLESLYFLLPCHSNYATWIDVTAVTQLQPASSAQPGANVRQLASIRCNPDAENAIVAAGVSSPAPAPGVVLLDLHRAKPNELNTIAPSHSLRFRVG